MKCMICDKSLPVPKIHLKDGRNYHKECVLRIKEINGLPMCKEIERKLKVMGKP